MRGLGVVPGVLRRVPGALGAVGVLWASALESGIGGVQRLVPGGAVLGHIVPGGVVPVGWTAGALELVLPLLEFAGPLLLLAALLPPLRRRRKKRLRRK